VTATVRVYINTHGIDIPASSTALEAIEAWNAGEAGAIRNGDRMITDSRGLPADPASAVHNGAIFRVVRARSAAPDEDE
jgi:hypothetical protein